MVSTESKLVEVEVYPNAANIKRVAKVKLDKGLNEIVLGKLESTIFPQSVRVTATGALKVIDSKFETEILPIKDLKLASLEEDLRKLKELKLERDYLEIEIKSLERLIKNIEDAKEKALIAYAYKSLTGEVAGDKLASILEGLEEQRGKLLTKHRETREKIDLIQQEIKRLEGTIVDESETVETGIIKLLVRVEEKGEFEIGVSYMVGKVSWEPTYDIIIKDKTRLLMFAKVYQDTNIPWRETRLKISNKALRVARITKPKPWYIETYKVPEAPKPHPMARKMKRAGEPIALMKAEPLAYEEAKIEMGEIQRFEIMEKVSIDPGKHQLIFLTTIDADADKRYIWDAFLDTEAIEVLEILNKEKEISPGEARIFKEDAFVGVTNIPRILPEQKIEVPITWEEKLEVEKRLIDREEKKTGIIKGKAYTKYVYELSVKNWKNQPVKIKVLDRIPVSKDPEIEVEFKEENVDPLPTKIEMGIIEWELESNPMEEKKIRYSYTVRYPPEKEPINLP